MGTRNLWNFWRPILLKLPVPLAYVAQDGSEFPDYGPPWDEFSCLFIGGTTYFKLSPMAYTLVQEARWRGKWVHMGRVNTLKRLRLAYSWGCDSVDGSCFSRWGDKFLLWAVRFIGRLKQQPSLF